MESNTNPSLEENTALELEPPSEPLTVQSVAEAYAKRDTILFPNVSAQCRMSKHMEKLCWYEESDSIYSNRIKNKASAIFMKTAQDDMITASEIWNQAKQDIVRRQENERVKQLLADIEEGASIEMLYKTHFTLDGLICLGW